MINIYFKKNIFMLCLLLCLSVIVKAQDHMPFMGIELNGTINDFQSKITSKGFTKNDFISSKLPNGYRVFNGTFASYNCFLEVLYIEKSKIVFQSNVIIKCNNNKEADKVYNDLKSLLLVKYSNFEHTDTLDHGSPLFGIGIKNIGSKAVPYLGEIDLTKVYKEIYGITSNWIVLSYQDKLNAYNFQLSRMDDL